MLQQQFSKKKRREKDSQITCISFFCLRWVVTNTNEKKISEARLTCIYSFNSTIVSLFFEIFFSMFVGMIITTHTQT